MDEKNILVNSSKMFLRANSNITKRNNVKILDTLQNHATHIVSVLNLDFGKLKYEKKTNSRKGGKLS